MHTWRTLFTLSIGLLFPTLGQAVSPYEAVQQGNTLYQAGQYREAGQQAASGKFELKRRCADKRVSM